MVTAASCGGEATPETRSDISTPDPTLAVPDTTTSPTPETTSPPSSTTLAPSTTTTTATTTTTTTLEVTPTERGIVIGTSLEGREIVAFEIGPPAEVTVLVVGVIHGNEAAGLDIIEELRAMEPPPGVQWWLVPTINPDGLAAERRGNAAGVDLNRNFPHDWGPIAEPGNWQYAGEGPASEPETRAFVDFAENLRPDLTLWYHQDLYRISPAQGLEGEIRQTYADLTGLPVVSITGGTYTGVAATWQRRRVGGIAFVVELGPELGPGEARRHAEAVHEIGRLLARP